MVETQSKPSSSEYIEPHSGDAKQDASGATSGAAERVRSSADKMATAATHASRAGKAAMESAKEFTGGWSDGVRGYIRKKPVQSVIIAVAAGWLIGRLMHRR